MPSRMLFQSMLVHSPAGGQQQAPPDVRFSRELLSDDTMYNRVVDIGESWQQLDCAWIKQAGMVRLSNEEGRYSINPTADVRAEVEGRVLEIAFVDGITPTGAADIVVQVREAAIFQPVNLARVWVRSRKGVIRCRVAAVPC